MKQVSFPHPLYQNDVEWMLGTCCDVAFECTTLHIYTTRGSCATFAGQFAFRLPLANTSGSSSSSDGFGTREDVFRLRLAHAGDTKSESGPETLSLPLLTKALSGCAQFERIACSLPVPHLPPSLHPPISSRCSHNGIAARRRRLCSFIRPGCIQYARVISCMS